MCSAYSHELSPLIPDASNLGSKGNLDGFFVLLEREAAAVSIETARLVPIVAMHLLMDILPDVKSVLCTDFDDAYMEIIDDLLDLLGRASGRRCKRQNTKVRIELHQMSHDVAVCICASGTMGLI